MTLTQSLPVVYTAQSKHNFFCRDVICEFVLRRQAVPLNPFRIFDYFLGDRVDRDLIRRANNNCVRVADEIWVFGEISDGVFHEIRYALDLGKPVRYFNLSTRVEGISEVRPHETSLEDEVESSVGLSEERLRKVIVSAAR
ncbi:hypothetical protein ACGFZL_06210 [Streptomyces sp. NPDC048182]|uniref:DUF7768 domain-containing protein n=1 Tax=Streptomyces sp. NPDC048182 TaxID=3365507 RepID=UPI0037119442